MQHRPRRTARWPDFKAVAAPQLTESIGYTTPVIQCGPIDWDARNRAVVRAHHLITDMALALAAKRAAADV